MFNREYGFIKDIGIFLMTRIGVITISDMQVREMKDVREGHIFRIIKIKRSINFLRYNEGYKDITRE